MNSNQACSTSRRGSIVVMTAAGAIFMIGLLAMVTDVGWMYYNQARLQTATNAGFKAGMDKLRSIKADKALPIDEADRVKIRNRVRDVMIENGFTLSELTANPPVISFLSNDTEIRVNASQSVGLFFARVMDFQNATVAAKRDALQGFGAPVAPLGPPYAPLKDVPIASGLPVVEVFGKPDPTTHQYDPLLTAFASGVEYILKPGGDDVPVGTSSLVKILVPMVPKGTTNSSTEDKNGQTADTSLDSDGTGYKVDGAYSADTFLKAYGAAFWCLRRDNSDPGFLPVQWLLGYKKGSFMLPWDEQCKVMKKLIELNVGFRVLIQSGSTSTVDYVKNKVTAAGIAVSGITFENSSTVITDIINTTNANAATLGTGVLELKDENGFRPRIAVYSSQSETDPVEAALRAAQIPYGTYNPGRYEAYVAGSNNTIFDNDILNGALDNYTWIHCHHEDFTGMTGGCKKITDSCYTKRTGLSLTATATTDLCVYCRNYYFPASYTSATVGGVTARGAKSWGSSSDGNVTFSKQVVGKIAGVNTNTYYSYDTRLCNNYGLRCADRRTASGAWYIDRFNTSVVSGGAQSSNLCTTGDYERPTCQSFKTAWTTATNNGFTDDPNCARNSNTKLMVGGVLVSDSSGDSPLISLPTDNDFVRYPNRVQKMKYKIVRMIRQHVKDGGHLFSECYAPETLDVSLWQAKVYERMRGSADGQIRPASYTTSTGDYADCLAGNNFLLRLWFGATEIWASNLNINSSVTFDPYGKYPRDARCQTHSSSCSAGSGHTDGFNSTLLNTSATILHTVSSSKVGYLKGTVGGVGSYAFFGGHNPTNCATRRLILNNVLLGAFSTKEITGEAGFSKRVNYGILDMDNNAAVGGPTDYLDRLKLGYNDPIQLNDRVLPQAGNEATATTDGIDYHVNGDATASPSRYVIVPITDLPPSVQAANPLASSVYDLPQTTDAPNGVYNPASYTFTSSVRIIGFAMFEILDPSEYTRVGLDYQPGDAGDLGPVLPGQIRGRFVKWIIKPGELPLQ